MLKFRVIPTLLYRESGLVKGQRFDSWRGTGGAVQAVRVFNLREVDELLFLDIAATEQERAPDFALIDEIADNCEMPLAVGGGIATLEDAREAFRVGAEKVVLASHAIADPTLISRIAREFGSQSAVVSIDARKTDRGYRVMSHSGRVPTELCPRAWAISTQERGAGEILITSVDRDGTLGGFDLALCRDIASAVSVPVIAAGGAGTPQDVCECAVTTGVSAIAIGAMFQFTQFTPRDVKEKLRGAGIATRFSRR